MFKINGIELFVISNNYKEVKNVSRTYTGKGNYVVEFFDNDLYQSDITFTVEFTIPNTEWNNSNVEFQKNEIVNIESDDFTGTAVVQDITFVKQSSDVNFKRVSVSFGNTTQTNNTPDYTPRQDVKRSKTLTEKLLGEEFARRLSKSGRTISSSYNKIQQTSSSIQLNILNGLNGINSFSNGVDVVTQGITNIFSTTQTVINTLENVNTSVADLKNNGGKLIQEPAAFFGSLQTVLGNFKNVFKDNKYTIDVLAGIGNVEYPKPLQTSSLNQIDHDNISTLENANRILCLTNIYELLPIIKFDNTTELNTALQRIRVLHKNLTIQNENITGYLNELSRNAIQLTKDRNQNIPSLVEIVATGEPVQCLVTKYNGDNIDYETFERFCEFVIKKNKIKNIFSVNKKIFMPILGV